MRRTNLICVISLLIMVTLIIASAEFANAQMTMSPYAYAKKFRFTGLVELTYRDYNYSSTYYGRKSETEWTSFEQRYKLGLTGYIYHPKLVFFSTSVTFRKDNGDYDSGRELDARSINYDLSASILSTNPVSLDVYGLKTDATIEGTGTSPYTITSNTYGASLRIKKRKYPSIRIEYSHWDYSIETEKDFIVRKDKENEGDNFFNDEDDESDEERIIVRKRTVEKTVTDKFSIYVSGFLKTLKTGYSIRGNLWDYESPFRHYKGKNIETDTYTDIKKNNQLYTYFLYSDTDVEKLMSFTANVRLFPIGRLDHTYEYQYVTYETDSQKAESHTISNFLYYKLSRMSYGTARLRYRFGHRDGIREDSYDVNTGLHFGRPIKEFDFMCYYKFFYSRDERFGEFTSMENSLGVGISTRTFSLGKIYANYDALFWNYALSSLKKSEDSDIESAKAYSIEHRIRTGINGKGPRKGYWNIEAEGKIVDSDTDDVGPGIWFGEEQWAEKIRHYTLTGDISYPVWQRGLMTFRAGYTSGTTNSEPVERYYYEGRLNCRILRNLNLLAWWREEWRNKGWWAGSTSVERRRRQYGWKTREYQMKLDYIIRRITFSLEYYVYRLEEGPYTTENKRLYVRASRPF